MFWKNPHPYENAKTCCRAHAKPKVPHVTKGENSMYTDITSFWKEFCKRFALRELKRILCVCVAETPKCIKRTLTLHLVQPDPPMIPN